MDIDILPENKQWFRERFTQYTDIGGGDLRKEKVPEGNDEFEVSVKTI